MSGTQQRKYYLAYEDRYQRVYEQGVRFWSAFPHELKEDFEGLEKLLNLYYERVSAPGARPELATGERRLRGTQFHGGPVRHGMQDYRPALLEA